MPKDGSSANRGNGGLSQPWAVHAKKSRQKRQQIFENVQDILRRTPDAWKRKIITKWRKGLRLAQK